MSRRLPKISIITPSYNQGQFIEKTIKSVLSQNYPFLEYIVMDGGSTDGTINILKKYEKKIIWFSQKDKGQSHAINKGLKRATGEIMSYLNSDDYLEQDALLTIGEYFSKNEDAYWLTGKCRIVDQEGREIRELITLYKNFFLIYLRRKTFFYIVQFISQPATFWRRKALEKVGLFDESLHYSMDYEYWLRLMKAYKLHFLDIYLASYRVHRSSKAVISPERQFAAEYAIIAKYTRNPLIKVLHKVHIKLALLIYHLALRKY